MGVRTSTSYAHVCCGQHSDTNLALRRGIEVLLPSAGAGCRLFDCTSASLALGQDPGIVSKSSKVRENRLLGGLVIGLFHRSLCPLVLSTAHGARPRARRRSLAVRSVVHWWPSPLPAIGPGGGGFRRRLCLSPFAP